MMNRIRNVKKTGLTALLIVILLTFTGCVDYSKTAKEAQSNKAEGDLSVVDDTAKVEAKENIKEVEDETKIEDEKNGNTLTEEREEKQIGKLVNKDKTSPVIIATSPGTADICAALEIPLAGIPHSDSFVLPDVYTGATVVGMAMSPDMEIVSSLKPDWILSPVSLISDLQPKYDAIDTDYAFLNLSSVTGMYKSIQQLGQLFDKEEQANRLLRQFETFYDEYSSSHEEKEAPSVLILMGLPGAYVVATPNSYAGNLVELAGGKNVYSDETKDFINVNTEDMLEKDPDIILRTAHAMPESVMEMFGEEFSTNDIWKHFRAVKKGKVYDLNYKLFPMSANLQYKEALENLDKIFYGEQEGSDGTKIQTETKEAETKETDTKN